MAGTGVKKPPEASLNTERFLCRFSNHPGSMLCPGERAKGGSYAGRTFATARRHLERAYTRLCGDDNLTHRMLAALSLLIDATLHAEYTANKETCKVVAFPPVGAGQLGRWNVKKPSEIETETCRPRQPTTRVRLGRCSISGQMRCAGWRPVLTGGTPALDCSAVRATIVTGALLLVYNRGMLVVTAEVLVRLTGSRSVIPQTLRVAVFASLRILYWTVTPVRRPLRPGASFAAVCAGVGIGWLGGKVMGYLTFRLPNRIGLSETQDGLVAPGITCLAYGSTELLHGYGLLAVFIAAVAFRSVERRHRYRQNLHDFSGQIERLLMMVLLVCFGAAIAEGSIFRALSWQGEARSRNLTAERLADLAGGPLLRGERG